MAEIMWAFDGGPSYSPLVVIAIFLANVSLLLYLVYGAFQCGCRLVRGQHDRGVRLDTGKADEEAAAT